MKLKLLLIFILLTLFSVGTYLYFALDLFSKDKTASIHEASLKRADYLSKEFQNFVNYNYQQLVILDKLISQSNSDSKESILDSSKDLISFHIFKNGHERSSHFHNKTLLAQLFDGSDVKAEKFKLKKVHDELKSGFSKLITAKYVIQDLTQFYKIPTLAIISKSSKDHHMVGVLSLAQIKANFKQDQVFKSFLIDMRKYIRM